MRRIERLNELLRRELGTIVAKEVDLSDAIVTFTKITVSRDLNYADIYFSVIPDKLSQGVLAAINKEIFDIQQALNRRLAMRPVPKIRFHIDNEQSEAQKIDELLKGI